MIARDPEILAEERMWERWSAVRRTGQDNERRRPFVAVRRAAAIVPTPSSRIGDPAQERNAEPV